MDTVGFPITILPIVYRTGLELFLGIEHIQLGSRSDWLGFCDT
ncbi:hypothetical protein SAMN04488057_12162 [Cyclobacterium lianum]|uniref:Uncharacterized protein n=1 Tax=Cyclobacterium lianum TaxID=388280 RepID=A0A1M7QPR7_9BACT|nr:hypothetical protein SAMN04488057_12162 [Cyclobacterium lianum]